MAKRTARTGNEFENGDSDYANFKEIQLNNYIV